MFAHGRAAERAVPRLQIYLGVAVFLSLEGLLLLQALMARADGFLTVVDMQRRGLNHGLPFIWHLGMWGDLLFVSPLTGLIVGRYGGLWHARSIAAFATAAVGLTAAFGVVWSGGSGDEAHMHDHQLTPAGIVHLIYMSVALTVMGLFYFSTAGVPVRFVLGATALLAAHLFLGTHLALGVMALVVDLPWLPRSLLHDLLAWITFLGAVLILVLRAFLLVRSNADLSLAPRA